MVGRLRRTRLRQGAGTNGRLPCLGIEPGIGLSRANDAARLAGEQVERRLQITCGVDPGRGVGQRAQLLSLGLHAHHGLPRLGDVARGADKSHGAAGAVEVGSSACRQPALGLIVVADDAELRGILSASVGRERLPARRDHAAAIIGMNALEKHAQIGWRSRSHAEHFAATIAPAHVLIAWVEIPQSEPRRVDRQA